MINLKQAAGRCDDRLSESIPPCVDVNFRQSQLLDPWCVVRRPPHRDCGDAAFDALCNAEVMLPAWASGPQRPVQAFDCPPRPIPATGP